MYILLRRLMGFIVPVLFSGRNRPSYKKQRRRDKCLCGAARACMFEKRYSPLT